MTRRSRSGKIIDRGKKVQGHVCREGTPPERMDPVEQESTRHRGVGRKNIVTLVDIRVVNRTTGRHESFVNNSLTLSIRMNYWWTRIWVL